jgi:hypothetical protein
MLALREADRLAKGAREKGTKRGTTRVFEKPASLEDQGIDKNLADRARKAAGMSEAPVNLSARPRGWRGFLA